MAKLSAGFAIGAGLTQLPGLLVDAAKGAADDAAATARLQQAIRNLGGDYEAINAQVSAAIEGGQRLAFTDDQVRDSFQFLAAATGDSEESLKRQRIAMDLARGAGISLEQATKLVGKVNEENVETFRRMGIVIGDNATEAEALAAIQAKFAGQAETFANSTAGQFEQASIAMQEIKESIGTAVLPALAAVGTALAANLPAIQSFIGNLSAGIGERVGPAIERLTPMLNTARDAVMTFIGAIQGDWAGQASDQIDPLVQAIGNIGVFIRENVIPALDAFGAALSKVFSGDISGAITGLLDHFIDARLNLVEEAAKWAPAIMAEVVKIGIDVLAWAQAKLPEIIDRFEDWGLALVGWVEPHRPELMRQLQITGDEVSRWATTQAGVLSVTFTTEWVPAFIDWTSSVLSQLPGLLRTIANTVLDWLIATAPTIVETFFAEWLPAFVGWVPGAALALGKELVKISNTLGDFLLDIIKQAADWSINEGVPRMATLFVKLGEAVITGIIRGIANTAGMLFTALRGLAAQALQAAQEAIDARSPSRVFADKVGRPIGWGIIVGMLAEAGQINQTAGAIATGAVTAGAAATEAQAPILRQAWGRIIAGLPEAPEVKEGAKRFAGSWGRIIAALPQQPAVQQGERAFAGSWGRVIAGLGTSPEVQAGAKEFAGSWGRIIAGLQTETTPANDAITESVVKPIITSVEEARELADTINGTLTPAWQHMAVTTHDIFDDLRGDIDQAILAVKELASEIRSLPDIPSLPGGGGGGGEGGGTDPFNPIPGWGWDSLSQTNYITNTIDARGLDPAAVTRASGQDLADLSRRLLTAGAVG